MRTYAYLVRYESDFSIAQEKGLIPRNELSSNVQDLITWESFAELIATFDRYGDEDVCPRYYFGELRLTRLNFWSRIFLRKLTYHHIDAQWGPFLSSFMTPFLAMFAVITIFLNAMQVGLAAQAIESPYSSPGSFVSFSGYFAIFAMVCAALTVFSVVLLMVVMLLHDICFAIRITWEKKRDPDKESWKTRKSGVI